MTLNEVKRLCVGSFGLSSTRSRLFEGLCVINDKIADANFELEAWLNGSFITAKINPSDVDLVVIGESQRYDNDIQYRGILDWINSNDLVKQLRCHGKCMFPDFDVLGQAEVNYWTNLFGFGRNREPKGIAKVMLGRKGDE